MHTRTAAWIDQGLGRGSCKIKLTRFWMSNKLRNLCIRKDNGLGLFSSISHRTVTSKTAAFNTVRGFRYRVQ